MRPGSHLGPPLRPRALRPREPGWATTAPAQLVLGPGDRQWELFSRMLRREPWWEPVPAGLALTPRERMAAIPPGPSRYFAVHPGWRHWQPPGGAVH